jgi:hypothetical protein
MSTDPFLAMRLSVLSAKVSGPQFGAVSLGEIGAKKKARANRGDRMLLLVLKFEISDLRLEWVSDFRSQISDLRVGYSTR